MRPDPEPFSRSLTWRVKVASVKESGNIAPVSIWMPTTLSIRFDPGFIRSEFALGAFIRLLVATRNKPI